MRIGIYKIIAVAVVNFTLLLCSSPLFATHEISFAIDAAAAANNRLATNPTLPMLYYRKGDWKISVQPYIFNGNLDRQEIWQNNSIPVTTDGSFNGWGAGGSFSYAFAQRWGIYAFALGSTLSGDFGLNRDDANPNANFTEGLDATGSYQLLNIGIAYQLFGKENSRLVLPVFIGPSIVRVKTTQRLKEKYSRSSNRAEDDRPHTDVDIAGEGFVPGILFGAQAGINLGKHFQLNPFMIAGFSPEASIPLTLGSVRLDREANNTLSTTARLRRGEKANIEEFIGSVGINLIYRPWGLSANLTAPFLKNAIQGSFEGLSMTQFSISYSFGKYQK